MTTTPEPKTYMTLSADMPEADIIRVLDEWRKQSPDFEKRMKDADLNRQYFLGDYPRDRFKLPLGKATVKHNKIFECIKSVVPFITSKPAQPVCYPKQSDSVEKTDESKEISEFTQEILKKIYEDSKIQYLNEQNSINRYIYYIGLLRYGVQDKKIFTRLVTPKDVYFDCSAKTFEDSQRIGEKIMKTRDELISLFPSKEKEITKQLAGKKDDRYACEEWWTPELVLFVLEKKLVLQIKENPFKPKPDQPKNLMYYDKPPLPYVALNVFNIGERSIDDTTEIEQSMKLQDGINDLLRNMMDNARYVGSPLKVGKGISAAQLETVGKAEPGDSILIGENQEVSYLQAAGLPSFVENLLQRYENSIDSIFGTQATFRGEFE